MIEIQTSRLKLEPFSEKDFDCFVETMLTDPKVVEFYYSYQKLKDLNKIRAKALRDFWEEFEESRKHGFEIWAAKDSDSNFIGWAGLVHTELTDIYGGPELQYMLASKAHGKGYATEFAQAVLDEAKKEKRSAKVIATVDIPNKASTKVLEKAGLKFVSQIEAYGSTEMYLYEKKLF